jgi:hypothetical protein
LILVCSRCGGAAASGGIAAMRARPIMAYRETVATVGERG